MDVKSLCGWTAGFRMSWCHGNAHNNRGIMREEREETCQGSLKAADRAAAEIDFCFCVFFGCFVWLQVEHTHTDSQKSE